MEQDLVGKVALVTGGGSGMGRAAEFDTVVAEMEAIGGTALPVPTGSNHGDGRASRRALLTARSSVDSEEFVLIHRLAIALCIIVTLACGICCLYAR